MQESRAQGRDALGKSADQMLQFRVTPGFEAKGAICFGHGLSGQCPPLIEIDSHAIHIERGPHVGLVLEDAIDQSIQVGWAGRVGMSASELAVFFVVDGDELEIAEHAPREIEGPP